MTRSKVRSPKQQIPAFASREEEAEFWDTHDVTDYFDDFEYNPSWFQVEGPLSEVVTLHIDLETMDEVRTFAKERDLPPDVLLHIWILERRDAERQRRASGAGES